MEGEFIMEKSLMIKQKVGLKNYLFCKQLFQFRIQNKFGLEGFEYVNRKNEKKKKKLNYFN